MSMHKDSYVWFRVPGLVAGVILGLGSTVVAVPPEADRSTKLLRWIRLTDADAQPTGELPLSDSPGHESSLNVGATGADNCNDATVVAVTVGPAGSPNTVTITGDTSSATGPDCVGPFDLWWEAFEVDQCANVTLDFCGTTPRLSPIFASVASSCAPDGSACGGFFGADDISSVVCGDGNAWMSFETLPPGTYYYPIIADESALEDPPGPYVMHISAEECSGACCDAANNSCTEDVVEANCAGVDQEWHQGQQCLEVGCIGACCDTANNSCTEADCAGVDQEWHPGLQCYQTGCVGACCDTETEFCTDNVAEVNCPGPQQWSIFLRCGDLPCPISDGPDAVTGILRGCEQLAREGPVGSGTLGLGVWTTICNHGNVGIPLHRLPAIDHPAMWGNMYRLETVSGSTRLEQIGQSWIKHSFATSNSNECELGCPSPTPFSEITPFCSDTYAASQFDACGFGSKGLMGPRSAIHPYTGSFRLAGPELGSGGGCPINFPAANHIGHNHSIDENGVQDETDIMHRIQVPEVDIDATLHAGARFFQEGGYITGGEFLLGNGNQHDNVSHREVAVENSKRGPGWYLFPNISDTFERSPALDAWTDASQTIIEPAPLADGRGILGYEATDLGGGQWHYEYALFNQFNDASFGSFGVPIPTAVTVSNIGFHAPLNHAPVANADNYDNEPWTAVVSGGSITWSTDDFSSDPMANAIRWGTLYNFRFDADGPPQSVYATIGLFKTGGTVTAVTLSPRPAGPRDCNDNGIEDTCDLDCTAPGCVEPQCGDSSDCDGTGVPDECEIDCNGNGVDDRCDVADGVSPDCTGNGIPDECEPDCDGDGTADFCEILAGTSQDCDANGIPDVCEAPGACCFRSSAPNPETLAGAAPGDISVKNRYLSIKAGDAGRSQAIRVRFVDLPAPFDLWEFDNPSRDPLVDGPGDYFVGEPFQVCENGGEVLFSCIAGICSNPPNNACSTDVDCCGAAGPLPRHWFWAAPLVCGKGNAHFMDWNGFCNGGSCTGGLNPGSSCAEDADCTDFVHIFHEGFVPDGVYDVQVVDSSCSFQEEGSYSTPLTMTQGVWGDICSDGPGGACTGVADGNPEVIQDVLGLIDKFQNINALQKARADLVPGDDGTNNGPDFKVTIIGDALFALDAFQGFAYPFTPGDPCEPG